MPLDPVCRRLQLTERLFAFDRRKGALAAASLLLVLNLSCSQSEKKRDILIAAAMAGGALVGAATAPSNERSDLHAVYWGALFGVSAALIGNSIYKDEGQLTLLKNENERMKAEMDLIQTGNKILLDQGKGQYKSADGQTKLQGQKANWKLYQIDRWNKDDPHHLYHEDKLLEITPVDAQEK